MKRTGVLLLALGTLGVIGLNPAHAYDPYKAGATVTPVPDGGLPAPGFVPGKELSFDLDQTTPLEPGPGILAADPEQNLFWDGRPVLPGLTTSFDYSGSRTVAGAGADQDRQVDALGARRDALFTELNDDRSHLVYSTAPFAGFKLTVPASPLYGPVRPDPEDIEAELFGGPPTHFTWAEHRIDINADAADPAYNVDGLELWGLEPPPDGRDVPAAPGSSADSHYYSLKGDTATPGSFSVWNYDGVSTSTGYIPQSTIATAVESLLGFRGFGENIELDALMMQDINGAATSFDPGDNIYFSIRQIGDTGDPDGFYATGSEIFTLESTAAGISPGFLFHGGHFWDHAWTLDYMAFFDTAEQVWLQLDVDAIESVSVPEPASILLIGLAGAVTLLRRRS